MERHDLPSMFLRALGTLHGIGLTESDQLSGKPVYRDLALTAVISV